MMKRLWAWILPAKPTREKDLPARPVVAVQWDVGALPTEDTVRTGVCNRLKKSRAERIDISNSVRRSCPLVLKNTGSQTAYNVKVQPITGTRGQLTFPKTVACFEAGQQVEVPGVYLRNSLYQSYPPNFPEGIENYFWHEAFLLSDEEWINCGFLEQDIVVSYDDERNHIYATGARLWYQPVKTQGEVVQLWFMEWPVTFTLSKIRVVPLWWKSK